MTPPPAAAIKVLLGTRSVSGNQNHNRTLARAIKVVPRNQIGVREPVRELHCNLNKKSLPVKSVKSVKSVRESLQSTK